VSQSTLSVYPRGWFVVAFSSEIAVGQAKQLAYWGEKLVAFRGEDGAIRVLDAYCAHMGADLAGGKVVGNDIQCPFTRGSIAAPASASRSLREKIPLKARQRVWTAREINGVILVWHDSAGGAPDFDIPVIAEYGSADWLPWSEFMYSIKTHPREIIENIADRGHFPAVHRTEVLDFSVTIDRHMATQYTKGFAKLPGGGVDNFASTTTYHGPGYLIMKMDGALQNYMLVAHTPIDTNSLHLRMGVMLRSSATRRRPRGTSPNTWRTSNRIRRRHQDLGKQALPRDSHLL